MYDLAYFIESLYDWDELFVPYEGPVDSSNTEETDENIKNT